MKRGLVQRRKLLYGSAMVLTFFVPVAAAALLNDEVTSPSHNQKSEIKVEASTEGLPGPDVSSESIEVEASTNASATVKQQGGQAEVTVNGVNIPVPENGTVEQTVPSASNQASIRVNIQSDSSTSAHDSDDSTDIDIDSDSDTEVRIRSRAD